MVLWSGGWCFLLLALFYLIIEIGGIAKWAFPFIIIGSNAIIAYIGAPFLKEGILWLLGDKTPLFVIKHIVPLTVLVITWLILYFLYRKKWFLRV
jgi:predicted acyltransferase